jgi:predicted transcriptional regulator
MADIQELLMVQVALESKQARVKSLTDKRLECILACLNNGSTVKEISETLSISKTRVYKILEKGKQSG